MVARLLAVFAFQAASAYAACTCTPASLESTKSRAIAIFRGTISEIRDLGADYPSLNTVYFDVTRVWKGQVGPVYGMSLHGILQDGCVGLPASFLKVGSDLLVYVFRTPEGYDYVSTCSRTTLAKDTKDFDELGPGYDPNIRESNVLVVPTTPKDNQASLDTRANRTSNLPDGPTLFRRYLEATKDDSAARTLTLMGELVLKNPPLRGTLVIHQDIGGNSYRAIDLPPLGKFEGGFDGTVGWSRDPVAGARILPKQEVQQGMFGLSPDDVKNWNTRFTVETIGEDAVDGQRCYLVRMTPRATGRTATACLDDASGLMVKMILTVHNQSGDTESTQIMRDYRDEGGIKLPHQIETTASGLPMLINLTEIKRNIELPPHVFDLPDDIRALVDAEKLRNDPGR